MRRSMEVIMKKNYLLLMGLLLFVPCMSASDDESDDEETPVITRADVGIFADGFKAGAASLNNLSKLFNYFGQRVQEISERLPGDAERIGYQAHAALGNATQVAKGIASTAVSRIGEDTTSLLSRGKYAFDVLDRANNTISTVINKVNRTVQNVHTIFTAAKFLKDNLTHEEKDFKDPYGENEISFESPYLRNNQTLRTLIEQNTENIIPIKKRSVFHATIQNTNNRIKGVIFYGEPGTGKTETARALAKKLNIPFMFKSVSDIFATKFAGEAAEEVKRFFQEARRLVQQSTSKHPIKIIILLDEIDRLAAKRASGNALRSEYGGAVMSDNNNTITAF
ncbi:AAA family ATPase, partial [bacterium]|nr:AAA family ATPase [bacterium]